jgi:hypothetical protein
MCVCVLVIGKARARLWCACATIHPVLCVCVCACSTSRECVRPPHSPLHAPVRACVRRCARVQSKRTRVVCLRLGVVLDPSGGVLAKLLPLFRLGAGGNLGSGRQYFR